MYDSLIKKLYNEYVSNGFISEDEVFDTLQKDGVPLFDVEYICDQLLARGVIILEESIESDDKAWSESADLTQTDYNAIYSEIIELDEGLSNIVEYMRNVKPPQRREWKSLIHQAQSGNKYARNRIFEMYMRVAARIALQYAKRYELSIADTMQDAFCGLLVAIDKFEHDKQDHFTAYFPFWIRQMIMREAQIRYFPFYISVHIKDRLFAIFNLKSSHNCPECVWNNLCPNLVSEISLKLECTKKDAEYLYNLLQPVISIEDLIEKDFSENAEESIGGLNDAICCYEDDIINAQVDSEELRRNLLACLKTLTEREERVLRIRYGLDDGKERTLEEVGNVFSITRERIRQIEAKALRKLRHSSRAHKLNCYFETSRITKQKEKSK